MSERDQDSTFDKYEENWIITECQDLSSIEMKRKFIKHFGRTTRNQSLRPKIFKRVFDRLKKNGIPSIGLENDTEILTVKVVSKFLKIVIHSCRIYIRLK